MAFDTKLRCDMVDLYYALYGNKRPLCLQSAEMASMYKDFIKEGTSKKSSSSGDFKPIEITTETGVKTNNERIGSTDSPTGLDTGMSLKRTAAEAFDTDAVDIIKLENNEEMIVSGGSIKMESFDDSKDGIILNDSSNFAQESKRIKHEYDGDNSVTIVDIAGAAGGSPRSMAGSIDMGSFKQEDDSKSKSDNSSKVKLFRLRFNFLLS